MKMIASKTERTDGWWYPWLFVGAFAVIIAVNGVMAYFALSTWTGLETDKAFQRGQQFNALLAQQAAQDQLGWTTHLAFEPQPTAENPRAGFVSLRFRDAEGQGVNSLAINALAMRPTHEGFDQDLKFTGRGNGLYVAHAALPLPGQWELRLTARRADETFSLKQRIQVP